MNENDDQSLLAALRAQHRALDEEIAHTAAAGDVDQLELARLKKRKLRLKDEIQLLLDRVTPDIIA